MKGLKNPLLHIVDPTAQEIQSHGLNTVALLGTKVTMSSPYLILQYSNRFNISIVVPTEQEQEYIGRVIFNELAYSRFTAEARDKYMDIVDALAARGAQGVKLGCREIALLITQLDRPHIPIFDTLTLHAKAAVIKAVYG